MAKRQTIILIVMVIAVLYGVYSLVTAPTARHDATDAKSLIADLQSFVIQTAAQIVKNAPSKFDIYVTSRAESGWVRNPFSGPAAPVSRESKEKVAQQSPFVYNGYIEAGNRKVAIINNCEYLVGEQLDREGYFVKMISPARVQIENRKEKKEFTVPVSE